jgi:hypothetical protein
MPRNDEDLDDHAWHIRESIGMDDKVVEAYVKRQMDRNSAGLPWDDERS